MDGVIWKKKCNKILGKVGWLDGGILCYNNVIIDVYVIYMYYVCCEIVLYRFMW